MMKATDHIQKILYDCPDVGVYARAVSPLMKPDMFFDVMIGLSEHDSARNVFRNCIRIVDWEMTPFADRNYDYENFLAENLPDLSRDECEKHIDAGTAVSRTMLFQRMCRRVGLRYALGKNPTELEVRRRCMRMLADRMVGGAETLLIYVYANVPALGDTSVKAGIDAVLHGLDPADNCTRAVQEILAQGRCVDLPREVVDEVWRIAEQRPALLPAMLISMHSLFTADDWIRAIDIAHQYRDTTVAAFIASKMPGHFVYLYHHVARIFPLIENAGLFIRLNQGALLTGIGPIVDVRLARTLFYRKRFPDIFPDPVPGPDGPQCELPEWW